LSSHFNPRFLIPPNGNGNGNQPPTARLVLPALTLLEFQGVSEWLEVVAARIDVPQLRQVIITFFDQFVFDIPQFYRFIFHEASKAYSLSLGIWPTHYAHISFSWKQVESPILRYFRWEMLCRGIERQVHSIAQMCAHFLSLLSTVKSLSVNYLVVNDGSLTILPDDVDPTRWIDLFTSFSSVERLNIHGKLEPFIGAALKGLTGESAAQVLPVLQHLSIDRPINNTAAQEGMRSFVTARKHSGHPVAIHRKSVLPW
jgi:hypothetical protein